MSNSFNCNSWLKLPEVVKTWQIRFQKSFEEMKAGSRKLNWAYPGAGVVDLQVVNEKGDTVRLLVSALQATVLLLFQDRDEMLIREVLEAIGGPSAGGDALEQLRSCIEFWSGHGILFAVGDCIVTMHSEKRSTTMVEKQDLFAAIQDSSPGIGGSGASFDKDIEEIWPMLNGMLTNLGASSIDVIHRTLSMFISDFSLDAEKLGHILDIMVERDMLEKKGRGSYAIKQ